LGHRRINAPRRGSLSYLPRKRAERLVCRVVYWPSVNDARPRLLACLGYKAGMTHIFIKDDYERSQTFGREIFRSATILETPPLVFCALRAYTRAVNGITTLTETWANKLPKDLERSVKMPEKIDTDAGLAKLEKALDGVVEFRAILCAQPRLAAVSKKKPEIIEVKIAGGAMKDQLEYAKSLLGKTIKVSDIFRAGQYLDIIGVTKGKGVQGPVKRFGVKVLQKKSRKVKRKPATLGPWTPHTVMHTVPRAGQMGFHRRTEYNKKILKTGNNGEEITPNSGFHKYGVIKGDYIILAGSVIGPTKRAIVLRYPARPPKLQEKPPEITYVNITPIKS